MKEWLQETYIHLFILRCEQQTVSLLVIIWLSGTSGPDQHNETSQSKLSCWTLLLLPLLFFPIPAPAYPYVVPQICPSAYTFLLGQGVQPPQTCSRAGQKEPDWLCITDDISISRMLIGWEMRGNMEGIDWGANWEQENCGEKSHKRSNNTVWTALTMLDTCHCF